jgi:hypothetical protein
LWCALRYHRRKYTSFSSLLSLSFCRMGGGGWWVIYVIVFIYVYWCQTRFLYQIVVLLFNSNTICSSSGTGTGLIFRSTRVHHRVLVDALVAQSVFVYCFIDHCLVFLTFGADLTTVLPVLFKYCCKYCYSDSRKLWTVMKGGGLAL